MNFLYHQQVPIQFGMNALEQLPAVIEQLQRTHGLLITTKSMVNNGTAQAILEQSHGAITQYIYDIQPNPTIANTDACLNMLRSEAFDFVVALGGGSVLDCAKVAAALAPTTATTQQYFDGHVTLTTAGLPLIAVPTTAGTASEITKVSVLSDPQTGKKAPLNSPFLYPSYALIDPALTLSCSPTVTATSGIDVLAHSLEALYNKHHQPFTDLFAKHAARLVFHYLPIAYAQPSNEEARLKMAEASVAAGLAFNVTQTAAAHACSYPLTEQLDVPHGEACAFTLPYFWMFNAEHDDRLEAISQELGFSDATALAQQIEVLKQQLGLRQTWAAIGVTTDKQLQQIVAASFAPNMANNPVAMTAESLFTLFKRIGA